MYVKYLCLSFDCVYTIRYSRSVCQSVFFHLFFSVSFTIEFVSTCIVLSCLKQPISFMIEQWDQISWLERIILTYIEIHHDLASVKKLPLHLSFQHSFILVYSFVISIHSFIHNFLFSNILEFLMYHVADGSFYSSDLKDGQFVPSLLQDQEIQVGVRVDGCSRKCVFCCQLFDKKCLCNWTSTFNRPKIHSFFIYFSISFL